ncbi:cupin domain-containing protein [Ahniella affigens]|nr:cupin domain-containing protein [Ahniella affigens]
MATDPTEAMTDEKLLGDVLERLPNPALDPARKAALGARLTERLAASNRATVLPGIAAIRADEGDWHRIGEGVRIKPLRANLADGTQTSLWRIDAGARVPKHAHHHEEECLVVSGQIVMAGVRYQTGDFVLAGDGSEHPEFLAETDTTLLIRGQLEAGLRPVFARALGLVA